MEEPQRHFVLVHGVCHGAWCWYKVATLLESAGHKVTVLDLAASGIHPKQAHELNSFSDYFEPLVEFMSSLPPEERVILVGHSMGGISISVAMERITDKISAGVFAAAYMPGPDLDYPAIREKYDRIISSYGDSEITFDDGPDKPPTSFLFGPNFLSTMLYQLSPPEDITLAKALIRPFRLDSYAAVQAEEVLTKERYGSVPRIYVVCDQDKVLTEELQRWMIENNPTEEVKVISGSDHMVMFSKPKELCACLLEIALKYSS